jgi:hypothetical protein
MFRTTRALASLLLLASSLAACGDDDDAPVDSGTSPADLGGTDLGSSDLGGDVDAGADVDAGGEVDAGSDVDAGAAADAGAEVDAGSATPLHCTGSTVFIADIDPGSSIVLFNPTGADINLTGYQFCQVPFYEPISGTVPARGSLSIPWPSRFTGTDAGGEVALYTSGSFGSAAAQIDFICWGTGNPGGSSRKGVAEMDGDWSGPCVGAVTGASLTRLPNTDGSGASSYDASDDLSLVTCP